MSEVPLYMVCKHAAVWPCRVVIQGYLTYKKTNPPRTLP